MNFSEIGQPNDWGKSEREKLLTLVNDFCDAFMEKPTFVNKERLIAITTFDEPTRHKNLGLVRFSKYESALINTLYFKFKLLNFQYGINFLYDILLMSAHLLKMVSQFPNNEIELLNCYVGLLPYLKYFFMVSYYFFANKNRSFADELINEISIIEKTGVVDAQENAVMFNTVLYDLSGKCNNHFFNELNFKRNEIMKLFNKSSELMKKAKFRQTERPHKGVLCMALSNFVLRSRNNYIFENIYKCISKNTLFSSFQNEELWMKKRSKLNDKREGRVMKEIFANRKWIQFEWARNVKFSFERESFTCSFFTRLPTKKQKEIYGEYIYGYHNDIVGPSITTLFKKENIETKKEIAAFSQYIMYDVLYSRDDFKKEMNFLFSIIDNFCLEDEEKKEFLGEIIDYWKLTIKDKRWADENERRYEIMHFDSHSYIECKIDGIYLKNKTPLLLYPDFIVGNNPRKAILRNNIIAKASYKNFGHSSIICEDCLYESSWMNIKNGCKICKSLNLNSINLKMDRKV